MPLRNRDSHLRGRKHIRKVMEMGVDTNIYMCEVCDLEMPTYSKESHLQGKKHLKRVVRLFQDGDTYSCEICNLKMPSYSKETHIRGRKHIRQMKLFYDPKGDQFYCKTCDRKMPSHAKASHETGKVHLKRMGLLTTNTMNHTTTTNTTSISSTRNLIAEWECTICDKTIPSYSKASHLQGRAHKRQEKMQQKKLDQECREKIQKELISFDFDSRSFNLRTTKRDPVVVDNLSFFEESEDIMMRKMKENKKKVCNREHGEACSACDLADVVESTVLSVLPPEE